MSVALHALVAWWLCSRHTHEPAVVTERAPERAPETIDVVMLDEPAEVPSVGERRPPTAVAHARSAAAGGHGGAPRGGHAAHADPWGELQIGVDDTATVARRAAATGSGSGGGGVLGSGTGGGIGFGDGGGIAASAQVPPPAAPPPPSRARPAKLLRPARDREVLDDDYLFVARVTVDEDGDVVAVRMVATHPGPRGEQAASAIWSFHDAPALDDADMPIRSTFEQPFQIR
jgi:hypothetical protein